MRNFIGRAEDIALLQNIWKDGRTKAISLYGRRRVGKTALIDHFCKDKKAFLFEALEGESTSGQIRHFLAQMARVFDEPHLKDLAYDDWPPVFDLLTQKISSFKHVILSFDELPWMAAGRGKLIAYIKYYWDRSWKNHPHLLFILCGSIASWMIKNVVRSKALYGRLSQHLLIKPLKPAEVSEYIGKKRGQNELAEYLLCFGGIPRYLEEFDFNRSIQTNINASCFNRNGFFVHEADKVFYNQFLETQLYRKIVNLVIKTPLSLEEISRKLKMKSSGGLKNYLDNLIAADILATTEKIRHFKPAKRNLYFVSDEFLIFNHWFIKPHLTEINASLQHDHFLKFTKDKWPVFLGLVFEKFCLKYRYLIADALEIRSHVIACGGVLENHKNGFQFDLAFLRDDNTITLCEIKHLSQKAGTSLIREFERKVTKANLPRGVTVEKVLICNQPASEPLMESGYFNRVLTLADLVKQ